MIYAIIFGGLASYVRMNGFLIFLIIISTYLFNFFINNKEKKFNLKHKITIALKNLIIYFLLFIIIITPLLINRANEFGSPFDYGPNSKILVDNFEEVWSNNIQNPGMIEFISEQNFISLFNRYFVHGFLKIIYELIFIKDAYSGFNIILYLLVPFMIVGLFTTKPDHHFCALHISIIVYILAFSLIYSLSPKG
jgi:hypothetical protein